MREIETETELEQALQTGSLRNLVVQDLDLVAYERELLSVDLQGCVLLGCRIPNTIANRLMRRGAMLFPHFAGLPFNPYRRCLYSPVELFRGFEPSRPASYTETLDARIYGWWRETGGGEPNDLRVVLARRLHDVSIADGIHDFLAELDAAVGVPPRQRATSNLAPQSVRRVAIMGGHSMPRTEVAYQEVVQLASQLAGRGWLLISGGGPGAMEATHLGTWLAEAPPPLTSDVLRHLSLAPHYLDQEWLARAFEVLQGPLHSIRPRPSLSIPTWLYGHEPPNPFASHVAKHFNNSLREEGLVTLASGGIVFAPGSAGTIQEIFQDATQNHYGVGGRICPMVFLGKRYWRETLPVWPLILQLSRGREWAERIALVDSVEEAAEALEQMPTLEI